VAASAVVAAGCGGKSGGPSVANLGGSATTTTASTSNSSGSPLQFARCMRSHGVPNFPDPSSSGGFVITAASGIVKGSPQVQSATQACRKYLAAGRGGPVPAADREKFLEFSACMRSHGLTTFPDPQFSGGGVRLSINPSSGLDPNSPLFQHAQTACQKYLPGRGKGQLKTGPAARPGS